ncbi:uncharacterized protein LOC128318005 [Pangasianodon hypophthalmus]|uniref:uncharacterized protein LOC128318005 n=1 Tax=Pangasianodon hypophthalmus TaxID=310915 RepID=UPI0023077760|nr:uncharacterized protein LOC128318005 [Pangasianodon hypophthalmus]
MNEIIEIFEDIQRVQQICPLTFPWSCNPRSGGELRPSESFSTPEATRVMELDAAAEHHDFVYVDEVGFNLAKTRRRGRNLREHCAIVNVPGRPGGNITMCAAISQNGVHHHATLGPYNTAHIITFLDTLHNILIPNDQRNWPEQSRVVVIWDNVRFHQTALVCNWFTAHPQILMLNLPPYSPFLNPVEEFFFSVGCWKVYDRQPHQHIPLLQAMEEACGDIHSKK